jgi:chemotaxis protein MotB
MLNPADPMDPSNRRISIIVLNKVTEQAVLHEGANSIPTSAADPLEPAAIEEATPK